MSAQVCQSGFSLTSPQFPQPFSTHNTLTILRQQEERVMQNGGHIFLCQWQAAIKLRQAGREANGAFPLLPGVNSNFFYYQPWLLAFH